MSDTANAILVHQPPPVPYGQYPRFVFCLIPAIAMSLGWGLRGFIGGGPLGAMIPGSMVGLILCHLLRLDKSTSAFIAAFGAIGIGFGGQMTYGQTIGFIVHPETFFWGLLGLSVKGGIWGLIGGTFLGLGFIHKQMRRNILVVGLLWLIVGTLVGWKWINEPKLIYFSNPHDRPRAEIWAGLLFGTLFLLGYLGLTGSAKIPLHFALWGALGGAIGFGGGGLWMSLGKKLPAAQQWISWWKLMEFTFGFCFGLALGWATWLKRAVIPSLLAQQRPAMSWIPSVAPSLAASAALGFIALWSDANVGIVWSFTTFGVVLLLAAVISEQIAWQIALTVTYSAFALDLTESYSKEPNSEGALLRWVFVAMTSLLFGLMVARREQSGKSMVKWAFLIFMWVAVVVSYLKSLAHSQLTPSHVIVELIFTIAAVGLTLFFLNDSHAGMADRKAPGN